MISLICSDLHGDVAAAQRLESLIQTYHPGRVLLLGDLFTSGMRWGVPVSYHPEKTLELLNRYADILLAVRGNCDRSEEIRQAKFDLPETRHLRQGSHIVFMIHDQRQLDDPLSDGDILLSGHTHIGSLTLSHGVIYANPGSLAWPRDTHGPTFLLMDDQRLSLLKADGRVLQSLPL